LGDGILPVFTIGGWDFACFYGWEMGFCLFSRLGDVILPVFTIGGWDFACFHDWGM
jgi:hypothetical protein